MKRNKKQLLACLLAAALASAAVTGCQSPGASAKETQGNEKAGTDNTGALAGDQNGADDKSATDQNRVDGTSAAEEDQSAEGNQKAMDYEACVKGKTLEAGEPEKVDISPEDYESWNKLLNENEVSEAFRKGLDQFAYKSGSAVLREAEGNGNYSPLSLYYALALAGCGAEKETASQILGNLGVEDQKELADQCRRLYQWYVYQNQRNQEQMAHYGIEDYKSTIRLGNSLWISDQLPVREDYQKLAAEKFFASSYGVDFADPDTGKQMGAWIAEKTNGVLEPQLTPDPGTLLAILNTLYFYGGWAEPFSEENTQEDVFTLEDGQQVTVPYLNRTEMMGDFHKGDGYTLSWLGTNNNCRMVFLLPDEGKTVGEFLESPQKLEAAMDVAEDGWTQGKVVWKVPKFGFGSSYRLEDTLKSMGMDRMFGGNAEFGGISPDPLMVSSVIQETHIGLDENGVEGAAYTMMALARGGILDNGEMAEMLLDRPFLFGIRDDAHSVWLFLGVCRNPSGEEGESVSGQGKDTLRDEKFQLVKRSMTAGWPGMPGASGSAGLEPGLCGLPMAPGSNAPGADPASDGEDLLLTGAPELWLSDGLSSTMNSFPVQPGSYSWNWKEGEQMMAVVACGSHPLEIDLEKAEVLKIPNYNGQKEVAYNVQAPVRPRILTVREWDISQAGKAQTAEPEETVYKDEILIFLKHNKIYEIEAEWPEEDLEKNGFFGEGSYVVVTE